MARVLFTVGVVLLISNPLCADETDPCARRCDDKLNCEREVTRCLIAAERAPEAVVRLKEIVSRQPDNAAYGRLLASAYLASGNRFWAERSLRAILEKDAGDCETRSWLAWVYIDQGDLPLAAEVLKETGCPVSDVDLGRWRILVSYMATAEQDGKAAGEALAMVKETKTLYPEDEPVWRTLRDKADPGWIEPLSLRLDILGGYTSNARAGSPADVSGQGPHSALGKADLYSRFVWPAHRLVRPAVEGEARAHGLTADSARDLSYIDLSIRPGLILGKASPRIFIAYRGALLITAQEDKRVYNEAHRGEAELETDFGLLVFAGAGRRFFRESGRTRTEVDGGLGWSGRFVDRLLLIVALRGRYHWAKSPQYDLGGANALISLRVDIAAGFFARVGVSPSVDYYLHSGGSRGSLAFGSSERRLDVTTRATGGLWSPRLSGVRLGIRYEYGWRDSTADGANTSYDYQEHRVLAGLRWSVDLNPWAPKTARPADHVPLDYGVGSSDGADLDRDRIQDLLRQDEAMRAGSSCMDR